jgi:hypothetical protein
MNIELLFHFNDEGSDWTERVKSKSCSLATVMEWKITNERRTGMFYVNLVVCRKFSVMFKTV